MSFFTDCELKSKFNKWRVENHVRCPCATMSSRNYGNHDVKASRIGRRGEGGGRGKVMISLHQQQTWQILTSSHSSLLPYLNLLPCIDWGSEGDVMSLHEQSGIYYFKPFPCTNLQILRNIENFQKLHLTKLLITQEFEYLWRYEARESVIVTLIKCEFFQIFW
jgi:hypothetical protein